MLRDQCSYRLLDVYVRIISITHDGSMVLYILMVTFISHQYTPVMLVYIPAIYDNIYHQYTPNVSIYIYIYIPAPWILWVMGIFVTKRHGLKPWYNLPP